ncbi:MAG: hypothetical protein M1816_007262 [Peltula sp. TS41687]|nr:MAG: hypothetical protein M1816_007262 [Peltula sp. TS41687]
MAKKISLKLLRAQQRDPPRPSRRLDKEQMFKATRALLKHIQNQREERQAGGTEKLDLLPSNPDDTVDEEDVPICLILTTKIHIVNKKRLKPGKITIPHPLNPPTSTICLITIDPQRAFKDVIADPSFPEHLRKRITRVIGVGKLRLKYKSYESRRQLHREHDIFLTDDRVLPSLPKILGKVFYKGTSKRPVPVSLTGPRNDRRPLEEGVKSVAKPLTMADEIERTLSTALVHLSPSTSTSIRVGRASWEDYRVVENIEAVVDALIRTFISRKWRNIRALHVKGPSTAALPIFMTKQLWMDDKDIIDGEQEAMALGARERNENDDDNEVEEEDEDTAEGAEDSEDDEEQSAEPIDRKKKKRKQPNDQNAAGGDHTTESTERKTKKKKRHHETGTDGNEMQEKRSRKKEKTEVSEGHHVDGSEKERKKSKKRHREEDEGGVRLEEVSEETKKAKKKVKREEDAGGVALGNDQKGKKEKKKKKKDQTVEDGLDEEIAFWKYKLKKQKVEAMDVE